MIKAEGLCKVFVRNEAAQGKKKLFEKKQKTKQEFYAVDHVDFCAQEGEILGILGPNGSGKTSFARQLLHLLKSDDGRIFYDETNIAKLSRKQIAKNGWVYPSVSNRGTHCFVRHKQGVFYDLKGSFSAPFKMLE